MTFCDAKKGRSPTGVTVLRVLTFLGVVASVSGCDLIYQPACEAACNGALGDDTFTREVTL